MVHFVGRLLSNALVVAIALAASSYPAWAQLEWECREGEANNPMFAEWLREFYVAHAQPILGLEQRLTNGVAWRLVIDAATRLAAPRITWMPDKQAMQKANRMFEAIQGCSMLTYNGMAASFYAISKGRDVPRPRSGFIVQSIEVATLSYATPNLVSAFEVVVEQTEAMMIPALIGRVLDLKRDKIVSPERCGDESGIWTLATMFRFGDLLEVCDAETHARFVALWESKINAVVNSQAYRRDAGVRYCNEDLDDGPASNRQFTL